MESDPVEEHQPIDLTTAEAEDAAAVVDVIHAAFGARPAIDPPPPALSETAESVAVSIAGESGVLAWIGDRLAGVILLGNRGNGTTVLQRVAVHPDFQGRGVATALVQAVQDYAADLGYRHAEIFVRKEFPALRQWWERNGYDEARELGHGYVLRHRLPLVAQIPTAEGMRDFGRRLAGELRAGDLLILNGELGAGKTTLTQGIGAGLGVEGDITSPTFVLSRVHQRTEGTGPSLVHVDAYRLSGAAELEDIDLESSAATSVTVVEWGAEIAERLDESRLEIGIDRSSDDDHGRTVHLNPIGPRWDDDAIEALTRAIDEVVQQNVIGWPDE